MGRAILLLALISLGGLIWANEVSAKHSEIPATLGGKEMEETMLGQVQSWLGQFRLSTSVGEEETDSQTDSGDKSPDLLANKLVTVVGESLETYFSIDVESTDQSFAGFVENGTRTFIGLITDGVDNICNSSSFPKFCDFYGDLRLVTILSIVSKLEINPISVSLTRAASSGAFAVQEIEHSVLNEHLHMMKKLSKSLKKKAFAHLRNMQLEGDSDCKGCIKEGLKLSAEATVKKIHFICEHSRCEKIQAACKFASEYKYLSQVALLLKLKPWEKVIKTCIVIGQCEVPSQMGFNSGSEKELHFLPASRPFILKGMTMGREMETEMEKGTEAQMEAQPYPVYGVVPLGEKDEQTGSYWNSLISFFSWKPSNSVNAVASATAENSVEHEVHDGEEKSFGLSRKFLVHSEHKEEEHEGEHKKRRDGKGGEEHFHGHRPENVEGRREVEEEGEEKEHKHGKKHNHKHRHGFGRHGHKKGEHEHEGKNKHKKNDEVVYQQAEAGKVFDVVGVDSVSLAKKDNGGTESMEREVSTSGVVRVARMLDETEGKKRPVLTTHLPTLGGRDGSQLRHREITGPRLHTHHGHWKENKERMQDLVSRWKARRSKTEEEKRVYEGDNKKETEDHQRKYKKIIGRSVREADMLVPSHHRHHEEFPFGDFERGHHKLNPHKLNPLENEDSMFAKHRFKTLRHSEDHHGKHGMYKSHGEGDKEEEETSETFGIMKIKAGRLLLEDVSELINSNGDEIQLVEEDLTEGRGEESEHDDHVGEGEGEGEREGENEGEGEAVSHDGRKHSGRHHNSIARAVGHFLGKRFFGSEGGRENKNDDDGGHHHHHHHREEDTDEIKEVSEKRHFHKHGEDRIRSKEGHHGLRHKGKTHIFEFQSHEKNEGDREEIEENISNEELFWFGSKLESSDPLGELSCVVERPNEINQLIETDVVDLDMGEGEGELEMGGDRDNRWKAVEAQEEGETIDASEVRFEEGGRPKETFEVVEDFVSEAIDPDLGRYVVDPEIEAGQVEGEEEEVVDGSEGTFEEDIDNGEIEGTPIDSGEGEVGMWEGSDNRWKAVEAQEEEETKDASEFRFEKYGVGELSEGFNEGKDIGNGDKNDAWWINSNSGDQSETGEEAKGVEEGGVELM